MPPEQDRAVGLLGLGEVGQILAADIHALTGREIRAFDILFDDPDSKPSLAALRIPGVRRCVSAPETATGSDIVISAVTAAQDIVAAQSVAAAIADDSWFLDLNSVSPATKQSVAELIDSAGGRYVEAAVMSPIEPLRCASPILLGGPHAAGFAATAAKLGFISASAFSARIGQASATKMCRSVVVKGIESLLTESMLAARAYGVEQDVLHSLQGLANNDDWEGFARYMISRSLEHGARRAEEMREVAATVRDVGVAPLMSSACAERQDIAASFPSAPGDASLSGLLDMMSVDRDADD
ncbi:MAG: DUF1932 domain-containing protein [Gammaproteobacteria bacterium]|nr:DUF1932 domain-containing protein [Gammaproteobacteria bacterium]